MIGVVERHRRTPRGAAWGDWKGSGDLASRLHLRLEVREYLAGLEPLAGAGPSGTRNDVVALVGLRLTRRPSSRRT